MLGYVEDTIGDQMMVLQMFYECYFCNLTFQGFNESIIGLQCVNGQEARM